VTELKLLHAQPCYSGYSFFEILFFSRFAVIATAVWPLQLTKRHPAMKTTISALAKQKVLLAADVKTLNTSALE
jgi:hypothetical protein